MTYPCENREFLSDHFGHTALPPLLVVDTRISPVSGCNKTSPV